MIAGNKLVDLFQLQPVMRSTSHLKDLDLARRYPGRNKWRSTGIPRMGYLHPTKVQHIEKETSVFKLFY